MRDEYLAYQDVESESMALEHGLKGGRERETCRAGLGFG